MCFYSTCIVHILDINSVLFGMFYVSLCKFHLNYKYASV